MSFFSSIGFDIGKDLNSQRMSGSASESMATSYIISYANTTLFHKQSRIEEIVLNSLLKYIVCYMKRYK